MHPTSKHVGRRAHGARLIGCVAVLIGSLAIAKDDDGRVKASFQKLDGRWKVTSCEVSGQKIETDEEWRFKSGNYQWIDSKRELRGSAAMNLTWNPPQIYFQHEHSSVTGPIETGDVRNWDSGIYKLSDDGDTLNVCLGLLPSKEFATTHDDKRRLYVLKRVKAEMPTK